MDIGIGLMNQELTKLKNLRNKVIDIEIQLGIIESDLLEAEKDLIFFENVYRLLKENLDTLKIDGIVVIADEYKKIAKEFISVKKKLKLCNDLHSNLLNKFDKYCDLREIAIDEYEKYKQFFESISSVIQFDPSKRKK